MRELSIEPIETAAELEELLPLIAAYQRFYEVEDVDEARNRAFFARFRHPSEVGAILVARGDEGSEGAVGGPADARGDAVGAAPLGYACLYWHLSSTRAAETVLMNDLFVVEAARGRGVGRALIEASAALARRRGAAVLEWTTAPDNRTAQRLYDTTGAARRAWLEYELEL